MPTESLASYDPEITALAARLPRSGTNRGARARLLLALYELTASKDINFRKILEGRQNIMAIVQFDFADPKSRRAVPEALRSMVSSIYMRWEVTVSAVALYYECHQKRPQPCSYASRLEIQAANLDPHTDRELNNPRLVMAGHVDGALDTRIDINPEGSPMMAIVRRYGPGELSGKTDPNNLPAEPFTPYRVKPAVIEAIATLFKPLPSTPQADIKNMVGSLIDPPNSGRKSFLPRLVERWFPGRAAEETTPPAQGVFVYDPRFRLPQ